MYEEIEIDGKKIKYKKHIDPEETGIVIEIPEIENINDLEKVVEEIDDEK